MLENLNSDSNFIIRIHQSRTKSKFYKKKDIAVNRNESTV